MPRAKNLAHLDAPLKEFKIPIVSWRPRQGEFKEFKKTSRMVYTIPEVINVRGKEWYRIAAYGPEETLEGLVLLPPKYYPLWRRLVYGALLQEKLFGAWLKGTKRMTENLNAVEKEMLRLKNNAGIRFVQYLLYRRHVLEELMALRFNDDNSEPVIQSLIEFGIRESRDWMFEKFEKAKKTEAIYLRLDPTNPKNKKEFGESQGSWYLIFFTPIPPEKGFHKGIEVLFPPEDNDAWWDGTFNHFDFDALFKDIKKSVPMTMADSSSGSSQLVLDPKDNVVQSITGASPAQWNEYDSVKITLFSEEFIQFLVQKGKG
jgi:hypothetical protein